MTPKQTGPRDIDILKPEQVSAMIDACGHKGRPPSSTVLRNRALIALLAATGIRVAELLGDGNLPPAMPKGLDLEAGTLHIQRSKGSRGKRIESPKQDGPKFESRQGKPRTMQLVGFREHIARWVERRAALGLNGRHPLVSTLEGGRLESAHARRLLKRVAERAGITERVHPHGLRHSHAAWLDAEGMPLSAIRDQLGHDYASTTDRYLVKCHGTRHLAPLSALDIGGAGGPWIGSSWPGKGAKA